MCVWLTAGGTIPEHKIRGPSWPEGPAPSDKRRTAALGTWGQAGRTAQMFTVSGEEEAESALSEGPRCGAVGRERLQAAGGHRQHFRKETGPQRRTRTRLGSQAGGACPDLLQPSLNAWS